MFSPSQIEDAVLDQAPGHHGRSTADDKSSAAGRSPPPNAMAASLLLRATRRQDLASPLAIAIVSGLRLVILSFPFLLGFVVLDQGVLFSAGLCMSRTDVSSEGLQLQLRG